MKHIAWIIALVWISCKEASTPDASTSDTATTTESSPVSAGNKTTSTGAYDSLSGCYRFVHNRDTVNLSITVKDTAVSGKMEYDNYQIDGSAGTIRGVVRNQQIIAYYEFTSEGMRSVREVAFKIQGGNLIQADTRDMSYRGDTAFYKDHQQIVFDSSRLFQPVDCSQL